MSILLIGFYIIGRLNTPRFKEGDLIYYKNSEIWEDQDIKLIKIVGKIKYQIMYVKSLDRVMNGYVSSMEISIIDNLYELYTGPRDNLEFK